jgi:hypothetical protein
MCFSTSEIKVVVSQNITIRIIYLNSALKIVPAEKDITSKKGNLQCVLKILPMQEPFVGLCYMQK